MSGVYLDEDVWLQLGEDLRAYGHDVAISRDRLPVGSSDALHFLSATQQRRILLTCNRSDFQLLHDAWHYWTSAWGVPHQHSGIIVADQSVPRSAHAASILSLLAGTLTCQNRLYEWRGGTNGRWYAYEQRKGTALNM